MTITQPHIHPYGFPRQARLLNRAQYQSVFEHCQYRSADHLLTVLACHNGIEQARLGIAVGKRSVKTAVARNRIKRVVRESFRHHQQNMEGLDIVVVGRSAVGNMSNPGLKKSLLRHWQRVTEQCAVC